MKRLLFLLLWTPALFSACKKSSGEELPEYYLQFTLNGAKTTYEKGGMEIWFDPNAYIAVAYENNEEENTIRVGVHSEADIVVSKEYVYPSEEVYLYYVDASGNSYGNYGSSSTTGKMKITEKTASYMSGNFSGTVINGSGTVLVITDGKFRLPVRPS